MLKIPLHQAHAYGTMVLSPMVSVIYNIPYIATELLVHTTPGINLIVHAGLRDYGSNGFRMNIRAGCPAWSGFAGSEI